MPWPCVLERLVFFQRAKKQQQQRRFPLGRGDGRKRLMGYSCTPAEAAAAAGVREGAIGDARLYIYSSLSLPLACVYLACGCSFSRRRPFLVACFLPNCRGD